MEPLADRDPRRVGPFLLLGRLGAGGMGTVFQGRAPSGRLVAVKTVHDHLADDPQFRARFAREVVAARRVNGFYTAEVVDADADAPVPWMATRFIDGPSLSEQVRRDGPLPADEVFVVGAGIAEALVCIHTEGLVHRDLKPSNVILAPEGLQVIDFGIAHVAEDSTLTGAGSLLGTFEYISPEQACGEPVSAATDVFSLGGVLHFAATGSPAFGTGHPWELLHRVHNTEPDLSGLTVPDLRSLVARCLARDPAARPTPREVVDLCAARTVSGRLPRQTGGDEGTPGAPTAGASTVVVPDPRATALIAPTRRAVLLGGAVAAGGTLATAGVIVARRLSSGSGAPRPVITIAAHRQGVRAVAFAPDGATFAVADTGPRVGIWRTADGSPVRELSGDGSQMLAVAWAPDGATLATGGAGGAVRLWDAGTGSLRHTLRGHDRWVMSVAFAPDGATLASTSRDFTLRSWDVASGGSPYTVEVDGQWPTAVVYSPDGAMLATADADGTAKIRAAGTGAVVRTLTGHTGPVSAVVYAPDGATLATAGEDGTARLWRAADGRALRTLAGHRGAVRALAYAPDGATVVTAGDDGTTRWWKASTGETVRVIDDHHAPVVAVAFSGDGARLATGAGDGTVRLREPTGRTLVTRTPPLGSGAAVDYSPDGATLATGGLDGTVRLWDAATGAPGHTLVGHADSVLDVRFAPDGRTVASAGDDATVRIWDVATGKPVRTLRPPVIQEKGSEISTAFREAFWKQVSALAFTPDGRLLLSCGQRGLQAWDPVAGTLVHAQPFLDGTMSALAVSADGTTAVVGNQGGTIMIWSPSDRRVRRVVEGHEGWVETVTYDPGGTMLASVGEDSAVLLRDPATGRVRRRLAGHAGYVYCAAFLAGTTLLATAGEDGIRLWDVASGTTVRRWSGHEGPVWGMAVAPDDRTLATIGVDGYVRVWEVQHATAR